MLRRIEPREVDTDPLQPSHPGLSSNVRQCYQLVEGLGVPADQGVGQGVEGDQGVVRVAPEGEVNAKDSKLKTSFQRWNLGKDPHRIKVFEMVFLVGQVCLIVESSQKKRKGVLVNSFFCTEGGKQEEIKKPRRAGEKQASFLVNFLVQVIWKLNKITLSSVIITYQICP